MTARTIESPMDGFLEKPLPSSPDAERCILGAVLLDNQLVAQAVEQLGAEDFYSPLHRRIFKAMTALFERSERIDPILIGEELKKDGSIDSIGGIATITNLTFGIPHFTAIDKYVEIVGQKARLRRLVKTCAAISASALAEESDVAEVLDAAQSRINDLCAGSVDEDFLTAGELALRAAHEYIARRASETTATGLLSGFRQIDHLLNGFQQADLVVIGARPRVGKTSLLLNFAEGFATRQPGAVVPVFSLEMKKDGPLSRRLICASAGVDASRFMRGMCTAEEERLITDACERFAGMNILINDAPALSPAAVRAKCLAIRARYRRIDAVMIDFLQKMSPSRSQENFRLEVASIARDLKNLAKDLNVPVIVLSALSRESEKRADKRPLLSDLSESNVIESEADVIAFLHRESLWSKDANPYGAEFIVAKNRNGPERSIELTWRGQFTRFEDA